MQYLGGKHLLAQEIVSVIGQYRQPNQVFIEPFCGGLNITCRIRGKRIASDANWELIECYKAVQQGWIPPDEISYIDYIRIRDNGKDAKLRGFVGVACSFGGKWFGGYARYTKRNYALDGKKFLLRKMKTCRDVKFIGCDYRKVKAIGSLIYCDPPYEGATNGYSVSNFDSEEFWQWCRNQSALGNTVIISEYNAPDDFQCIWEREVKSMVGIENRGDMRTEKLFIAP